MRNRVILFAGQVVFDNDFAVLLPYWHKLNALSYDPSRLIPNIMQGALHVSNRHTPEAGATQDHRLINLLKDDEKKPSLIKISEKIGVLPILLFEQVDKIERVKRQTFFHSSIRLYPDSSDTDTCLLKLLRMFAS